MPRPFICRRIQSEPGISYFKPAGIPFRDIEEVVLGVDEMEAIRLVDFEEKAQEEAAQFMNISQPTLSRLLASGRKKVAEAITIGKALKIHGGNYQISQKHRRFGRGFRGCWW